MENQPKANTPRLGKKYFYDSEKRTIELVHLVPLIQQFYCPPKAHHKTLSLQAFAYDVENGIRSGEPLCDFLAEYPPDIRDAYAKTILYNHRAYHWGLLSKGSDETKQLLTDLDSFIQQVRQHRLSGGLSALLKKFLTQGFPRWYKPLWSSKRAQLTTAARRLREAKAIARDLRLVNFPANTDSFALIAVTQKLIALTQAGLAEKEHGPKDTHFVKLSNAQLFSGVVCTVELWKEMVFRYSSSDGPAMGNFLPFAPILVPALNVSAWAEFPLSLTSIADLLGYWTNKSNTFMSRYGKNVIGRELVSGYSVEQLARIDTDKTSNPIDPAKLNPANKESPLRIGPQGAVGINHGYYLVHAQRADAVRDTVFDGFERKKMLPVPRGAAGSKEERNPIVHIFHPETWKNTPDFYRPSPVFRSHKARWDVWCKFVRENPETKPSLPLFTRTMDRRWPLYLRRYRNRDYDIKQLVTRPVHGDRDFSRGTMDLSVLQSLDKVLGAHISEIKEDDALLSHAATRYGPIRCRIESTGVHQKKRFIQAPSRQQKHDERHLNRLAQAAFQYLNRKIFDESIALYLVGTSPWMDSGTALARFVEGHREMPILNFDVVSCFDSIELLKNPAVLEQIKKSIRDIRGLGFAKEACLFEKVYLQYYEPLLRLVDSGQGLKRIGSTKREYKGIPAGFPLTPILLYLVLFEVFLHLSTCQRRGLIRGWVQAGDDTLAVGSERLANDVGARDEVWLPIKAFADRIGIRFSHWKNYTESGGLVPNYSKSRRPDFSGPWIDRFPLRHIPLYHAGVSVFKGDVQPNARFAGEDLSIDSTAARALQGHLQIKKTLFVSRQLAKPSLLVNSLLVHRMLIDPNKSANQLVSDCKVALSVRGAEGPKHLAQILGSEGTPKSEGSGDGRSRPEYLCNPELGDRRWYALEHHALNRGPLIHMGGWYYGQRHGSKEKNKREQWFLCPIPAEDRRRKAALMAEIVGTHATEADNAVKPLSDQEVEVLKVKFEECIDQEDYSTAKKVLGEFMYRDKGLISTQAAPLASNFFACCEPLAAVRH